MISTIERDIPQITNINIYPNPFKDFTHISCTILNQDYISVGIYDLNGKLIHRLSENEFIYSEFHTTWDGKDQEGRKVKAGAYLIRFKFGRNIITRIITLIK